MPVFQSERGNAYHDAPALTATNAAPANSQRTFAFARGPNNGWWGKSGTGVTSGSDNDAGDLHDTGSLTSHSIDLLVQRKSDCNANLIAMTAREA